MLGCNESNIISSSISANLGNSGEAIHKYSVKQCHHVRHHVGSSFPRTVEIKKRFPFGSVTFRLPFTSVPFRFRSHLAIRCILATRPTQRARNRRVSRGTTVAKHGPIIVKKRIKGDIAPTQLLEALPSHKNPRV